MIIEIREMDGASELDVQLAGYNATKIARDNGAITIIEHDDEIFRRPQGRSRPHDRVASEA